jgi:syntaxin-binding protein 1
MATGVDEDDKKPRNLTDQVVRLLDDDAVTMSDRLRLIMEYVLHRDGIFNTDIEKLLAHAHLPPQDGEVIQNLELLGARVNRQIKDQRPPPQPLFARKPMAQQRQEELSISRFEPIVKSMLEEQVRGTLDQGTFPYTKPLLDATDSLTNQVSMSQSSLRSAKPTWARTRPSANEPRQRIIVFIAGGATYSEARACYEVSRSFSKDVFLSSSHMLTPSLFLRQLGDLSVDRRRLDLPADRAPRKAPSHIYEREPLPTPQAIQPPTSGLAAMTMNSSGTDRNGSGTRSNGSTSRTSNQVPAPPPSVTAHAPGKVTKEPKEKKRFFKF